jgi:hypothetical protein
MILIVTDGAKENRLTDRTIETIINAGFHSDVYTDITPEAILETSEKLVTFSRKGNYTLLNI